MMKPIERLTNINAAIALVERTPAHVIDLSTWSYNGWLRTFMTGSVVPSLKALAAGKRGAHACFAGLLPSDPYFQSLGVRRDEGLCGRPVLAWESTVSPGHHYEIGGFDLAEHLFGTRWLFAQRGGSIGDGAVADGSDKDVVLYRLAKARKALMDVMTEEISTHRRAVFNVPTNFMVS